MTLEITRSARALLDGLATLPWQGPLLDAGSPEAIIAAHAADTLGTATYCHLDLRPCRTAAGDGRLTVHHADQLPPGPFATLVLDGRAFEPAFARELVAQAAGVLTADGLLLATPPDQEPLARWQELLAAHFGSVDVAVAADPPAFIARQPRPGAVATPAEAWTAEFAGQTLQMVTAPGIFSPRGLDAGTRAMLSTITPPPPGASFLDLGCGSGVVGIVAAACWGCTVTAVDVNARALRLTAQNAAANGQAIDVRASDGLSALAGREFDVIATHPPYHSDYAVAKAFIEAAHRQLRLEGSLWLVVKRPDWYAEKLRAVFGSCRVIERDGYYVLTAQRRPPRPKAAKEPAPAATTRKHAKRMAAAGGKKKRRP